MKQVSGKDLCRAVQRKGWNLARIKGSGPQGGGMQGFAVSGRAGTFLHLPRQLIPQQIQPGLAYRLPPGPFRRHLVNQALELFQQFRTPAQNPKPGCAQRREFFQHPQILRTHHQIQKVDGISLIKLRQYAGLTPVAPTTPSTRTAPSSTVPA